MAKFGLSILLGGRILCLVQRRPHGKGGDPMETVRAAGRTPVSGLNLWVTKSWRQ